MVKKKYKIIVLGCFLFLWFNILPHASAIAKPIEKGAPFPDIRIEMPKDPSYQKELGVSGKGDFGIEDIKAEVIVIQIFHSG